MELPVRALFDAPTVEQLAVLIEIERRALAAREAAWVRDASIDLRQGIDGMHDREIQAEIVRLQEELGSAASGHPTRH